MKTVRLVQACLAVIPILLLGWLLNQELVPSGEFRMERRVDERSPFLDRLLPDDRVGDVTTDTDGDVVQAVNGDPAFFFAHPHRDFETATVEVWFKNSEVPIIEFGGLANTQNQAYTLFPLQNLLIDRSVWQRLEQHGLVLLQRTPTYASVDEFLANPPPRHKLAAYHYTLQDAYLLPGYVASGRAQTTEVSLRGHHEFKTYIKDEPLDFTFAFMDMNRAIGADPVNVSVFGPDGRPVTDAVAHDDGNVDADGMSSSLRETRVHADGLPEGVYKIVLGVGNDIFFRSYSTNQSKVVFLNHLFLGDRVGYKDAAASVRLWTEAKHLAFKTRHVEGLQTVAVGDEEVTMTEPYKKYAHAVAAPGVVRVTIPHADVEVSMIGHSAFSPEQFFNPDPVRLTYDTDLDALDVDYVIARYTPPRKVGHWLVASATFDTEGLVFEDGSWKFTFSTPGIEEIETEFFVGKINMLWKRKPLWE